MSDQLDGTEEVFLTYQEDLRNWIVDLSEEDRATFAPHEQRVLTEYVELFEKFQGLEKFINGGDFGGATFIDEQDKFFLTQQYAYMLPYVDILSLRINKFLKGECTCSRHD